MSAHTYHDGLHLLVKALVNIVVSEHVVEPVSQQSRDMQLGEIDW